MTEKLSERVERLEGPVLRTVFLEVYAACYPNGGTPWASDVCHKARFELLVDKEAWLSAAEMLVPEGANSGDTVWNVEGWSSNGVHAPHVRATAWVAGAPRVYAATPANALLAAILKARGL